MSDFAFHLGQRAFERGIQAPIFDGDLIACLDLRDRGGSLAAVKAWWEGHAAARTRDRAEVGPAS